MALAVASGSFMSQAATGNFAVTGVGFQGTLLLLFGGAHPTGLGSRTSAHAYLGAAVSSSSRWCCGGNAADAQGTSITGRTQNLDGCYRELSGTGTIVAFDFVSWDADGFTLNQTAEGTGGASQFRVFYLVLGGADLTNVALGTFDTGTGTGTQAITGLGFQPDLLLMASSQHTLTSPTSEGNHAGMSLAVGVARSTTSRWAFGMGSPNNSASPDGIGVMRSDLVLTQVNPNSTSVNLDLDLASFDADGFTVDKEAMAATSRGLLWCALKGTYRAAVGTFTNPTSTGSQAITGVGFLPTALVFGSVGRVVTTTRSFGKGHAALGVALSPTNRRAIAADTILADPSQTDSHATETKALVHLGAGTPTILAEADLTSMDTDGFTLAWTINNATERQSGFLALAGEEDEGEPEPPATTRHYGLLLGVG